MSFLVISKSQKVFKKVEKTGMGSLTWCQCAAPFAVSGSIIILSVNRLPDLAASSKMLWS